jgi:predicted nucleotidyltransferase
MTKKAADKVQILLDCVRRPDIERICLFGSWARGEQDETSDLDVVVIMRTVLPFLERNLELCRTLPLELGAVDLLAYTPEEWQTMLREGNAFAETVEEEGRLIYERQEG